MTARGATLPRLGVSLKPQWRKLDHSLLCLRDLPFLFLLLLPPQQNLANGCELVTPDVRQAVCRVVLLRNK